MRYLETYSDILAFFFFEWGAGWRCGVVGDIWGPAAVRKPCDPSTCDRDILLIEMELEI
jgi:hypothetical protein